MAIFVLALTVLLMGSLLSGALQESGPGAALVGASGEGDLVEVRRLLREGADPNYALVELETRPLELALSNRHWAVARELVRAGARFGEVLQSNRVPPPPPEIVRELEALQAERRRGR